MIGTIFLVSQKTFCQFQMNVPVAASFKDVNTDMKMAPIDAEKASEYMVWFDVAFDDKVVDLYMNIFCYILDSLPQTHLTLYIVRVEQK